MESKIDKNSAGVSKSTVAPCYTVLDLFSGIGGFSLGLERTGGFKTIAFCEWEEHAQKILKKHWPDVPIFDDVRELNATKIVERVDIITGGFPCQDLSCAGVQKGFDGDKSSLYVEMLRLISEIRPKFAIFENVANLLYGDGGRWFSMFLNDLAKIGLDAEWHCISASYLGAPHHRDRMWILAYPTGKRQSFGEVIFSLAEKSRNNNGNWNGRRMDKPDIERVVDGVSRQLDRLQRCGNSIVPQMSEIIGRAILDV